MFLSQLSLIYQLIILGVLAYFLGAIPFALVVSKVKKVDLRSQGSGNLGATNVYRVMGIRYAVFVFVMDCVKVYLPTYMSMIVLENPYYHVGIGMIAVLAHTFTVFASFKGGKGVAASVGLLFALNPLVMFIVLVVGVIIIKVTRYVSLVSILGSILMPLLLYILDSPIEYVYVVSVISVFIIIRHRSNIGRLIKGTENKI